MNWRKYNVPDKASECQKLLKELTDDLQKDPNHVLWFLQSCGEGLKKEIDREEINIVLHGHWDRPEDAERCKSHRDRLLRDIRILGCLHQILLEKNIKDSAKSLADFFKATKKKK